MIHRFSLLKKKSFNPPPPPEKPKTFKPAVPTENILFTAQLRKFCQLRFGCEDIQTISECPSQTRTQDVLIRFKDGHSLKKKIITLSKTGTVYDFAFSEDMGKKVKAEVITETPEIITAESWMADNYGYIMGIRSQNSEMAFTIPADMLPDSVDVINEIAETIMKSGAFGGVMVNEDGTLSVIPLIA